MAAEALMAYTETLSKNKQALADIKAKLAGVREQMTLTLANERLKQGSKGDRLEAALEYYDSQLKSNDDTLRQRLEVLDAELDRYSEKLEAKKEAFLRQLDDDLRAFTAKIDAKKAKLEQAAESYEAHLTREKMSKHGEAGRAAEVKAATTLQFEKQIKELEKQETFYAGVVEKSEAQFKSLTKPADPYARPYVPTYEIPENEEEQALAKLRKAARIEASRNLADIKYSPANPYERLRLVEG
jgi:hypothetical protein